ncbi:hypothetical protein PUNSTDRAFT_50036, partial [Punctularia strigosozonata HHB-11173 SS5]|uniref:uncharacterized protein n=1 Tax=Punctularia strigosozonata (strain HHB-11173) TaxID=741275 RepID=UPI0004417E50
MSRGQWRGRVASAVYLMPVGQDIAPLQRNGVQNANPLSTHAARREQFKYAVRCSKELQRYVRMSVVGTALPSTRK